MGYSEDDPDFWRELGRTQSNGKDSEGEAFPISIIFSV